MDGIERAVAFVERHAVFFVVAGAVVCLAVVAAGAGLASAVRWAAETGASCR
jgi:hypothetical protein